MSPELRTCMSPCYAAFKTPRPRQNDRHFADDIFKYIFLKENIQISNKFFFICIRWPNWQYGSTDSDNGLAPYRHYLKQCWYVLQTHICVTRPQSTCNTSHEVYTLFVISDDLLVVILSLQWRHNECHGVSNRRCVDCLLNRLFGRRSKKTSKPHGTGLCGGNSPVTGEFPSQRASNAENVSIWWRHHFALAGFCWIIYHYSSGLLNWHWTNPMIAPVSVISFSRPTG